MRIAVLGLGNMGQALAGALAGAASGLLADALWHLVCPRVDLAHVVVWHFGATLLVAAAGALSGFLWGRARA